jgi:hypothetical protein
MRATTRVLVFIGLLTLTAGCSQSKQDDTVLDTSRLPRVGGAREVFASAAATTFTSPDSVAVTAEAVGKALAAAGWQKYVAPSTAVASDTNIRILSLKKAQQALGVFITTAPAQANATSVQYTAVALKNDLPFTKDASNIEYAPDLPLLTLVTAEPIDTTLDFYRKELGLRGWSLWSQKLNAKQPADGPSGVTHERGAYAHYVNEKKPTVALVLTEQFAEAGKFKVELKEWPIGVLTAAAPKPEVRPQELEAGPELSGLPAPKGRKNGSGSSASSGRTITADINADVGVVLAFYRRELAARNWKEETQGTVVGPDAATVAYSFAGGTAVLKLDRKSDLTAISLVQQNVGSAAKAEPAAKDDSIDAMMKQTLQLAQQAEVLSRMGDKSNVTGSRTALEVAGIKTPAAAAANPAPPAAMDDLEAEDSGGLPVPKRHSMVASSNTPFRRELTASVPLDLPAVLGFYRRELGKLNWQEDKAVAAVAQQDARVVFSSTAGPAALKLARKDGETTVNLVVKDPDAAGKAGIAPKPGQAKLAIVNPSDKEMAITINKQTIKVAAGAGAKGPDGAMLEVPPGKYKFSVKRAGEPSFNSEVDVGADETWGLMVGQGGAMPMQMY